jgi:hypothetical protein
MLLEPQVATVVLVEVVVAVEAVELVALAAQDLFICTIEREL